MTCFLIAKGPCWEPGLLTLSRSFSIPTGSPCCFSSSSVSAQKLPISRHKNGMSKVWKFEKCLSVQNFKKNITIQSHLYTYICIYVINGTHPSGYCISISLPIHSDDAKWKQLQLSCPRPQRLWWFLDSSSWNVNNDSLNLFSASNHQVGDLWFHCKQASPWRKNSSKTRIAQAFDNSKGFSGFDTSWGSGSHEWQLDSLATRALQVSVFTNGETSLAL